jgi:hypothetical protein
MCKRNFILINKDRFQNQKSNWVAKIKDSNLSFENPKKLIN